MESSAILSKITADLGRGEVALPTTARVALTLQRALDKPDCHIDEATRLITADPLLASKVVALANSTAYNPGGREITDLRTAASRLGFRCLRSLASSMVVRRLADKSLPRGRQMADALWEHTAHVTSLAHIIARRVTHVDPETAMFAAILHEIAGFYLIARANDYPELLDISFDDWSNGGEAKLGRAILQVLSVPTAVVTAIEECWEGFLEMPPSTVGGTLLLADDLAPVESPLHAIGDAPPDSSRASIDMLVGQEALHEIIAESARDVRSLIAALGR